MHHKILTLETSPAFMPWAAVCHFMSDWSWWGERCSATAVDWLEPHSYRKRAEFQQFLTLSSHQSLSDRLRVSAPYWIKIKKQNKEHHLTRSGPLRRGEACTTKVVEMAFCNVGVVPHAAGDTSLYPSLFCPAPHGQECSRTVNCSLSPVSAMVSS